MKKLLTKSTTRENIVYLIQLLVQRTMELKKLYADSDRDQSILIDILNLEKKSLILSTLPAHMKNSVVNMYVLAFEDDDFYTNETDPIVVVLDSVIVTSIPAALLPNPDRFKYVSIMKAPSEESLILKQRHLPRNKILHELVLTNLSLI